MKNSTRFTAIAITENMLFTTTYFILLECDIDYYPLCI